MASRDQRPGLRLSDVPDDEPRAQRDARIAAVHGVGSEVRLRHAVEPPDAASGAIADPEVTLLHPGRTEVLLGSAVALAALTSTALVLWLGLRARRPHAG